MHRKYDFDWFKVVWEPGYGWILDRPPAVVVVPLAPDERIWLERVTRVPTAATSWELPGGMLDDGESAMTAGLRELEEECGLVATGECCVLRSTLELAPGMGRLPHHTVVAHGVVPKGRRPVAQKEEKISAVRCFDRDEVWRLVRRAHINVLGTLGSLVSSGWLRDSSPDLRAAPRSSQRTPTRSRTRKS